MTEASKRKPVGSVYCKQYNCEAKFYVDELPDGQRLRLLVVRYGEGYSGRNDLPIVDGQPQFASDIPADWTEGDLHNLLLDPMNPKAPYAAWEVPARVYGSYELFRWWAGEKGK
jgi:hypothetical protein